MKTLSSEQQIALFRSNLVFVKHMYKLFLFGAGIGVVIAIVLWNPIPLMVSAFLAIVGFFERRAGPNIVEAIRAYDSYTPTDGTVSISINSDGDDIHYHATVHEQGHPVWEYEFVPQGWQQTPRTYSAKIWRTDVGKKPVLAVVEEGLLIPRYEPKVVLDKDGINTRN